VPPDQIKFRLGKFRKKSDQVKDQVNFSEKKSDQVKIRSIKHQDHRSSSGKVQFRYTSLDVTKALGLHFKELAGDARLQRVKLLGTSFKCWLLM
jgi:hypothetical protein